MVGSSGSTWTETNHAIESYVQSEFVHKKTKPIETIDGDSHRLRQCNLSDSQSTLALTVSLTRLQADSLWLSTNQPDPQVMYLSQPIAPSRTEKLLP